MARVRQISIFLENRAGTFVEIAGILEKNDINIRAVTVADTTRFGILRLIVDKPELCAQKLKEQEYTVSLTDVIAVGVSDTPGGLAKVARLLTESGVNIDYMYAFISHSTNDACVILRVGDPEIAEKVLQDNHVTMFDEDEVYKV